jgi:3-deoxy-D-manno-octulosonic-acid transferase
MALPMYLLYSALLAVTLVLGSPYWIYEMLRHGKYRKGLRERLGIVPSRIGSSGASIWVHAVSVGEVLAVSELVRRLRIEPSQHRVVISTTTDTGQALACKLFGAENVFYFPLDFSFAVRRWISALRPELIVIAETEFWPNFLRCAREQGARVAIVNARISDRSLPGYRRWKRILRRVLAAVEMFLAQTPEDAKRLVQIGAPEGRVFVGGNLKYDVATPTAAPILGQLRKSFAESEAGPLLVCGSTVEGEEAVLIEAFKNVQARYSSAVMLLAPRHPQRFDEVAELLERSGVPSRRRSEWDGEGLKGSVLLIDSIGELSSLYALADVAFVGGSLVPRGGHNIIEPAQHGVPIVVGPHTENFRDIVGLFLAKGGVHVVSSEELAAELLRLLENDSERAAFGRRAAETLRSQQGATEFTVAKLRGLLAERSREATWA